MNPKRSNFVLFVDGELWGLYSTKTNVLCAANRFIYEDVEDEVAAEKEINKLSDSWGEPCHIDPIVAVGLDGRIQIEKYTVDLEMED